MRSQENIHERTLAFKSAVGLASATALVALGGVLFNPASAATTVTSAASTVTCGQVITHTTRLSADIGPCPGDGIVLGANGITVDLGGHTISGIAAMGNDSAGARLNGRTHVTVMNGTITGFDAGVAIDGGAFNIIERLSLHDNIGALDQSGNFGDGVAIGVFVASPNNILQDNIIVHNGIFEGVGVFRAASTGNRIIHNVISENNVVTTRFPGAGITEDFGINLGHGVEGSNNTSIIDNTIDNNGPMGILACSFNGDPCVTANDLILNNHVEGNGVVFTQTNMGVLEGAIRVIDIANTGSPNDFSVSTHEQVIGNQVVNNVFGGIFTASRDNQFIHNVATGNDPNHNGILDLEDISQGQAANIPPCDHNLWLSNTWGYFENDPGTGLGSFAPSCVTVGGHGPTPGPFSNSAQAASAASSSATQTILTAPTIHRGG